MELIDPNTGQPLMEEKLPEITLQVGGTERPDMALWPCGHVLGTGQGRGGHGTAGRRQSRARHSREGWDTAKQSTAEEGQGKGGKGGAVRHQGGTDQGKAGKRGARPGGAGQGRADRPGQGGAEKRAGALRGRAARKETAGLGETRPAGHGKGERVGRMMWARQGVGGRDREAGQDGQLGARGRRRERQGGES